MKVAVKLKHVAPDLWLMTFPLKMMGADLQRNVTILRLSSGKLVIHSTAPFSSLDIETIYHLGQPTWLVDALLRHDTFSAQGCDAFPSARYLVPDGFEADAVSTRPLVPPPEEWAPEIEVLPVDGAPSFGEIVMFHRSSRTLVVGDLLFNFSGIQPLWTRILLLLGSVGGKYSPGVSRPFKAAIKDEAAFVASLKKILEWDFDRIIVGHGNPIPVDGKHLLVSALKTAGIRGL